MKCNIHLCEKKHFFHPLINSADTVNKKKYYYIIIISFQKVPSLKVFSEKVFFFSNIESCFYMTKHNCGGNVENRSQLLKSKHFVWISLLHVYSFGFPTFQIQSFWERQKGIAFHAKKVLKIEFSLSSSIPLFHILFLSGWISIWK